jgi:uncharacterized membrane protein
MNQSTVLLAAFLLGCVCGLRSMTGPALVCWGGRLGWLHLDGTKLSFLHNPVSLIVFSLLALGELVADKLPFIPSRIEPGPLGVRFLFGAMCGAALCLSANVGWIAGAMVGGVGGIVGGLAGYHLRRWLTKGRGLPDPPIALLEDAAAIGGGLFLVSLFK